MHSLICNKLMLEHKLKMEAKNEEIRLKNLSIQDKLEIEEFHSVEIILYEKIRNRK